MAHYIFSRSTPVMSGKYSYLLPVEIENFLYVEKYLRWAAIILY
jgi:hypothetical protein